MWQRFTERARRIILLAQHEAGKMDSGQVTAEHLMLGLLAERDTVAVQILQKMGVGIEAAQEKIHAQIAAAPATGGEPKLTPEAKQVLEFAAEESSELGHNYIGTEHLLLALLRASGGAAAQVFGIEEEALRAAILEYLGSGATSRKAVSEVEEVRALQIKIAALEKENQELRERLEKIANLEENRASDASA